MHQLTQNWYEPQYIKVEEEAINVTFLLVSNLSCPTFYLWMLKDSFIFASDYSPVIFLYIKSIYSVYQHLYNEDYICYIM